jgi:hypothetical protein
MRIGYQSPPGIKPLHKYDKIESRKKLGLPENGFIIGWLAPNGGSKKSTTSSRSCKRLPDLTFVMGGWWGFA